MSRDPAFLRVGVLATALATLLLEQLNSRLLSVVTWYHLAFFAVSLAMLGMAAGAVYVFAMGPDLQGERASAALAAHARRFAVSIALSHVTVLCIPVSGMQDLDFMETVGLAVTTAILTAPFFFSGVTISIALTRVTKEIGVLYGVDLLGAAAGCILVIPLLEHADVTSATLVAAGIAALGAACFTALDGARFARRAVGLALGFLAAASVNVAFDAPLSILYAKGTKLVRGTLAVQSWNTHSFVMAQRPELSPPVYWSAGNGASQEWLESSLLLIDGSAGTPITRWDGQRESVGWVQYDITALPFHLRAGDTAVIGVGGGRDVLAAIWGGSRHVLGIEVNGVVLHVLRESFRRFASIADRSDVELVHDEARSYLARTPERFDVIQMSLIDTWAATGAGAFTLSENGLYTVEAWRMFLGRLKPGGILSVSRWFSATDLSETSRLLSLAVAALLDIGVTDPSQHIVLVSRGTLATMLTAVDPLPQADLDRIHDVSNRLGFRVQLAPGRTAAAPRLGQIAGSRSRAELAAAVRHPDLDFTPPTDGRPYFFNLLKPSRFYHLSFLGRTESTELAEGVIAGNIRATTTLVVLLGSATLLAAIILGGPLASLGLPAMPVREFTLAAGYFALIGAGYMLVQIPFLQRFSVYLGHPTYALAVVLFSMILFSGLGSLASDRLHRESPWIVVVPLIAAAWIALVLLLIQPALESTVQLSLPLRCVVVVPFLGPGSFLLGFCFPLGLRVVARSSALATAWMWAINGASGVVASILAVLISIAAGIHTNLGLAACCYVCLAVVSRRMLDTRRS